MSLLLSLLVAPTVALTVPMAAAQVPLIAPLGSALPVAVDNCRIYKISEAKAITQSCPIITNNDFIDARKACLSEKKSQSLACVAARSAIDSQLMTLRSRYELMVQQQQSAAGGFTTSTSPELSKFYDEANSVMTLINNANSASKCNLVSAANALIPFVSLFAPAPGFMLGAGTTLFQKLAGLLKSTKMPIGDKLALCGANQAFQSSREKACTVLGLSDPERRTQVENYLSRLNARIAKGKDTSAYRFLKASAELEGSLKALQAVGDRPSRNYAVEIQERTKKVIATLACNRPMIKPTCDSLASIKDELASAVFNEPNADTAKRAEAIKRVARRIEETVLAHALRKDLADDERWGHHAFACERNEPGCASSYPSRLLAESQSYDATAESLKSAFESIPRKIQTDLPVDSLCAATSCIWSKSNAGAKASTKSELATQWDPTSAQSLSTYIAAGSKTFVGWSETISPHTNVMSQLASKCKASTAICSLNCQVMPSFDMTTVEGTSRMSGPASGASSIH